MKKILLLCTVAILLAACAPVASPPEPVTTTKPTVLSYTGVDSYKGGAGTYIIDCPHNVDLHSSTCTVTVSTNTACVTREQAQILPTLTVSYDKEASEGRIFTGSNGTWIVTENYIPYDHDRGGESKCQAEAQMIVVFKEGGTVTKLP